MPITPNPDQFSECATESTSLVQRRRVTSRGVPFVAVVLLLLVAACASDGTDTDAGAGEPPSTSSTTTTSPSTTEAPTPPASTAPEAEIETCWTAHELLAPGQVPDAGFEILERLDDGTMQVWMSPAITLDEFDALDLPPTWIKNQPRSSGGGGGGGPDAGSFCGSPGSTDGSMTIAEHFGHRWAHVATILELGVPMNDEGTLRAARIAKEHQITYYAGTTTPLLISPDGEIFPLVSRDTRRTTDESPIPAGWTVVDHTFTEDYTTRLPNPILNIRVENEDSYQGPVTGLEIES